VELSRFNTSAAPGEEATKKSEDNVIIIGGVKLRKRHND
jgi:hypothetical protein